jgi:hypothetical protein
LLTDELLRNAAVVLASAQPAAPVHGLKLKKRLVPVVSVAEPTKLVPSFDQHQELTPNLGSTYALFGKIAAIIMGSASGVVTAAGAGEAVAAAVAAGLAAVVEVLAAGLAAVVEVAAAGLAAVAEVVTVVSTGSG